MAGNSMRSPVFAWAIQIGSSGEPPRRLNNYVSHRVQQQRMPWSAAIAYTIERKNRMCSMIQGFSPANCMIKATLGLLTPGTNNS